MVASESKFVRKLFHKEVHFISVGNNSYPLRPGGNKRSNILKQTCNF